VPELGISKLIEIQEISTPKSAKKECRLDKF
jgi:hypothetical protein